MKEKSGRRSFIKNVSMGSISAAILPAGLATASDVQPENEPGKNQAPQKNGRPYNTAYQGANLNRVAFPLGGLGAGMFCMEGTGAISHMSVRNRPEIFHTPSMFAAISVKGLKNGAKLLEGPVPDWKKFGQRSAGNGSEGATIGLPHFHHASFTTRFPFGHIDLSDNDVPLKIKLTGWSPFVPTEDDQSGLPVAAMEYQFTNTGKTTAEAVFSFNSKNFLKIDEGRNAINSLEHGFALTEAGTTEKPQPSSFAIFTDDAATIVDHCWFRGGWWDPLTMAWNTVKTGEVKSVAPVEKDAPGASLYVPFSIAPGKEKTIRVMMAWYTPDSDLTFGDVGKRKENCDPASGCCNSPADIGLDKYDHDFDGKFYKPWYSSRFKNVEEVAAHWLQQYEALKKNSLLFTKAFYASTLPPEVIEAVAANLTILKSPTMMRQYDGRLWNWEGCGDDGGCCHGSCTHVWNYTQAVAHLFPALERSLRNTEFCESQDEKGHQNFRAVLPIKPATHEFHSAADGQLGGIMKVYREWRVSGDTGWLKKIFPMVQKSMDYCIATWDPRHVGVIEEPHHNTYDIEFWGPDGMHTSFYVGALQATIEMGKFLGKDTAAYQQLHSSAKKMMETALYDGEYFIQQIKVEGLNAKNPATEKSFGGEYSAEARELLDKEGPKYQYGKGCLSDGILGAWIGRMCGLEDTIDQAKIASHLKAIHKYNLKDNLSEHANPQRPAYAAGEEGGLLLCTWPKGGKLSLPFVYSDEVWTGIEHQVASHLMLMGHVKEGLEVLRASRDRYDGRVRNPFNEYECGHWYARALSSYGYLQALTGVRYDGVDKTLFVDSKIGDFTSFLSTETGFGTVTLKAGKVSVDVVFGKIDVSKIMVSGKQMHA
ncbi:GH116 family glycosyl hydrolase [Ferruginibacter paludis]|uniref:GH116 family glycosyl hydrolase n=1 Tax=Ferruginibacter paludis TaxID=1310417 RepID=UPI0025B3482C|nr:GH116 family glycosyl hydrolase [Ferruginibacter paludis]MDN3655478.1 GH116 family glycosyl hydrolase [Ferruginibacter paludis]